MPKQIDVAEFSQDILKKSMPLFAKNGYQGLSMRQLASALNITTGTLYHYFKNKDELYIQMLNLLAQEDASSLVFDTSASLTLDQKTDALARFLVKRSAYFFQLLQLIFEHQRFISSASESVSPLLLSVFEKPVSLYEKTLQDIFGLTTLQAKALLNYLIGCFVRSLFSQTEPDFTYLPQIMTAFLKNKTLEGSHHE